MLDTYYDQSFDSRRALIDQIEAAHAERPAFDVGKIKVRFAAFPDGSMMAMLSPADMQRITDAIEAFRRERDAAESQLRDTKIQLENTRKTVSELTAGRGAWGPWAAGFAWGMAAACIIVAFAWRLVHGG